MSTCRAGEWDLVAPDDGAFLKLFAVGRVQAQSSEPADSDRIAGLVGQYADLDLGQRMLRSSRWPSGSGSGASRRSTDATSQLSARSTYPPSSWSRTSRLNSTRGAVTVPTRAKPWLKSGP
jgi:hypothetical protein